jgi:hypothetical protein
MAFNAPAFWAFFRVPTLDVGSLAVNLAGISVSAQVFLYFNLILLIYC